jgi:ATP-dependent Lon protease
VLLLRMVPFVEHNYNMMELGPRGTGKSHLFQQISPYAHLVSGGKSTVARMFVNMSTGQRGLVCQYDVVCFDEVAGVSFDQKDGVNIMKGYMESGEFSRGKESIRAYGGIVLVGNFEVDVEHQQRIGHLFGPLPPEMRHDTAFMDRIQAYLPGWDVPKISEAIKTEHFGLVSDFLSECWARLRSHNRAAVLQGRVTCGRALSGRDQNAVHKTTSGLLKLIHPSPDALVPDQDLEWAVRLGLECRRRATGHDRARVIEAHRRDCLQKNRLGRRRRPFRRPVHAEDQLVELWTVAHGPQSFLNGLQLGRHQNLNRRVLEIAIGASRQADGVLRADLQRFFQS